MNQKHVGIDLESQIRKIKKMTPLRSFLLVFLVPRGAEKHKKSRKNDSKMRTKIYRFFQPILKRFLLDFPPIWDPKISKSQPKSHAKSKQKNLLKMIPKISILASKVECFFNVFGYQNRLLEAPRAHQGVQTENHLQNSSKIIQVIKNHSKMI